jgi:hypothetical protein
MLGYQLLAKPVVHAMQSSNAFTHAVHAVVSPWLRHARFLDGTAHEADVLGGLTHNYGSAFTRAVGKVAMWAGIESDFPDCCFPNSTYFSR